MPFSSSAKTVSVKDKAVSKNNTFTVLNLLWLKVLDGGS